MQSAECLAEISAMKLQSCINGKADAGNTHLEDAAVELVALGISSQSSLN